MAAAMGPQPSFLGRIIVETVKVTALKEQRSNPDRLNVFIDGRYAFPVLRSVAEYEGLEVGRALSPADVERLKRSDVLLKARDAAYRLLSYRPRSIAEVRTRLQRKGYDADIIDSVVKYLEDAGYLDDREFARFWVENREAFNPRGSRLLKSELRQKGVDSATVDQALAEDSDLDQESAAMDLARHKAASYRGLERDAFYRRLAGFLQRRGFDYPVVSKVVRDLWQEVSDGAADDSLAQVDDN
jgi:regulatory protein